MTRKRTNRETAMKNETGIHVRPNLKIVRGFPDLVPFVSVFFILIFFFVLGSSYVPVQGFRVTLPQAAAETSYVSRYCVVTVDAQDNLYFNDAPAASFDVLKRRIAESLSGREGVTDLAVRSDKQVRAETLTKLLEIAGELNLNVKLMVDPPAKTIKTNFMESE